MKQMSYKAPNSSEFFMASKKATINQEISKLPNPPPNYDITLLNKYEKVKLS